MSNVKTRPISNRAMMDVESLYRRQWVVKPHSIERVVIVNVTKPAAQPGLAGNLAADQNVDH